MFLFRAKPITNISKTTESTSVPLPSAEDIVRNFCVLVDERRVSEALSLMDIPDETTKQAWGVYLNTFSSFKLININKSKLEGSDNTFEVDLRVSLNPGAEKNPIPNYGWVNGINKRWITVERLNGLYKVTEIATGP